MKSFCNSTYFDVYYLFLPIDLDVERNIYDKIFMNYKAELRPRKADGNKKLPVTFDLTVQTISSLVR